VSFGKILIANRGEIAGRIIRTARELGYMTVAVYSDADRDAPFVRAADEAVRIGPAGVAESYLNQDAILEAAARTGAEAIHPGYGFLAENADFATACAAAGLVFIGPDPESIALMGNKRAAKARIAEAGIPCIPGFWQENASDEVLIEAATEIGFPIMVKAAAGGGGRGMRLVTSTEDLAEAIRSARSEAELGFGCDELILERAIAAPRHIEIQIVADDEGHVLSLYERDCSVQRRHQKVVEEAPSPALSDDLRARMGEAAAAVARAVDYVGVGTVEFLLDEDGRFYFMEMNTRLQVEHGVTELVTGVDLVALQIQIANGEPLDLYPDEVPIIGHAIEVRLYAEDAAAGYLPRTGRIEAWLPPAAEGIRIDSDLEVGRRITADYDPMLAKILAWGGDRDQARRRLLTAMRDLFIAGIVTNRDVLIRVLDHPTFADGEATTHFLNEHFGQISAPAPSIAHRTLAVALCQWLSARSMPVPDCLRDWHSSLPAPLPYRLAWPGGEETCRLVPTAHGCYQVQLEDGTHEVVIESVAPPRVRATIAGIARQARFHLGEDGTLTLDLDGVSISFRDLSLEPVATTDQHGEGRLRAVMDGRIVAIDARVGDSVVRGQTLITMAAMKMEHRIEGDLDGTVAAVHVAAGDQVAAHQTLLEIRAEEPT